MCKIRELFIGFNESFFDRYKNDFIEFNNDLSIVNTRKLILNILTKEEKVMNEYYNKLINKSINIEECEKYTNFRYKYYKELNKMNTIIQEYYIYNDKYRYIDYEALKNIEKIKENTLIELFTKEIIHVNKYIKQLKIIINDLCNIKNVIKKIKIDL